MPIDVQKLCQEKGEMYELRDEAVRVLTPKSAHNVTETTAPESWTFKRLAVSRCAGVTLMQFKEEQDFGEEETVSDIRDDFTQLADRLMKDSRILLDFTGIMSFSSDAIDAIVQFKLHLRTKGSRIVLCGLGPEVKPTFFDRSPVYE